MSIVEHYPHVLVDEQGTARIGQTRYKVMHLAAEHYHYGWSAEELLGQHSDLRPEEVYAALTYFYDHFDELIRQMKAENAEVQLLRAKQTLSRAELLARQPRSE